VNFAVASRYATSVTLLIYIPGEQEAVLQDKHIPLNDLSGGHGEFAIGSEVRGLTLQRHFRALAKLAHVESRVCGCML
jgi:hypothetical protein